MKTTLQPTKMLFQSPQPGDRVGIVISADDYVVRMVGYGVRVEDSTPAVTVPGEYAAKLRKASLKNPCLQADDGTIVWGLECWWGPENSIKKWIGSRRVLIVKPHRD